MGQLSFSQADQLEALVKAYQYLAGLISDREVWVELEKVLTHYFKADLVAFLGRRPDGEIVLHHLSPLEQITSEQVLQETAATAAEVLESGFLATEMLPLPQPFAVAFLPISERKQATRVMLVGHRRSEPLPRSLLDIYLAMAGLCGTTLERLSSERRVQRMTEKVPEMLFELLVYPDGTLQFTYVSRQSQAIFFQPPDALLDNPNLIFNAMHPEDRPGFLAALTQAPAAGTHISREFRNLTPGGREGYILFHALASPQEDGVVVWDGAFLDITRRKQAEEVLKESEERHRAVVESATEAIVSTNSRGEIVSWNRGAQATFGYSEEEVLGRPVTLLMPPRYLPAQEAAMVRLRASGDSSLQGRTVEFEGLRRDGREFPLELSLSAWEAGKERFYTAIIRDLTARKLAESEVKRLLQQNDLILNFAGEGILGVDLAGKITFVNPAAARMAGRTVRELIGREHHKLVHHTRNDGTPYPREECPIHAVTRDGKVRRADDEVFWRQDGTRFPVEYTSAPMLNEQGELLGAAVVFRDITERKQREMEIRQLNEELEQRVRERTGQLEAANKELESFAYSVSHDLRAPLRAIDGFSHILLEDYYDQLDDAAKGFLDRIMAGSQRMGQLIDDILKLSRLSRAEMTLTLVDLSAMVREIAAELRDAEPHRQVEFSIEDNLVVAGSPRLLRVALVNLMGNAWKFTSKKPRGKIAFGRTAHGGEGCYFVRDNGSGFPIAYVEKIFKPFEQLHREDEFPGTGIGLAMVHRIIERHGGRVWVESAEGQGSTFYFTLKETSHD
ncbi:MAG: PAS domain-containing sensor histidine kinase [Desulfobaccales bacterium]